MNDDAYKKKELWSSTIRSDILVTQRVLSYLDQLGVKDKNIIDLGCGNGKVCKALAKKGAKVVGVDLEEQMIDYAKEISDTENLDISYYQYDISDERIVDLGENEYDIALSLMVYLHLNSKKVKDAMENTYRLLKDDGYFILGNIHPYRIMEKENSPWIKALYDVEDKSYFEENILESYIYSIEGKGTKLKYYHHSMEYLLNSLIDSGFKIERIIEPRPTDEELEKYKGLFIYEHKRPSYLIIIGKKTKYK